MGCSQSKDKAQDFDDINQNGELRPRPLPVSPERPDPQPNPDRLEYVGTDVGTYILHLDFRVRPRQPNRGERPRVRPGELFTDDDFPLDVAVKDADNLVWKRPREYVDNPVLFSDGTTRFDIGQRNPQTCWFLSILANLSEDQEFFRRVLTNDSYYTSPDRYDGIFHCKLWKFGRWHDVYIDDYLPGGIDRNNRLFIWTAHSVTDENEMWVSLMEKAFARFHGSYDEVYGGQPGDAYLALTGGVSERIVFEDHRIEPIKLFDRIRNALRSGALVSCGVWEDYRDVNGLIGQHAYSLNSTTMVETRQGDREWLLRVRNPWGRVEWRGDWSDTSRKWHNLVEGARIPDHAEDGEFWISIGDFLRYFFQLTICSITPDVDVDGRRDDLHYVTSIYGEWQGRTAAGARNFQENPNFIFTIPDNNRRRNNQVTPIVVQLIQDIESRQDRTPSINCYLYKGEGRNRAEIVPLNPSPFINSQQIAQRYLIEPGTYTIIPSTFNPRVEKDFLIRIFSPSGLTDVRLTMNHRGKKLKYQATDVGTYEVYIDYRRNPTPHGEAQRPRINRGSLYTDDEFPLEVATKDNGGLLWLRPWEIIDNPVLIADETTRFDVGQGSVGTCWFLAILASFVEKWGLMQRVMTADDYSQHEGVFHCKFWRFGQWRDVYIDDCLPVKRRNNQIWSSKSDSNLREMWVSLIEKAFARFHGSYDEVDGGHMSNAYLALTGGVSETIIVNGEDIIPEQLFKRVQHAVKSGALVTCTFKVKEKGLISGHAYSLNATEIVTTTDGRPVHLLRVRNPWGFSEWNGDWCDGSHLWKLLPKHVYSRIRTQTDDGEFWMSLHDGMRYFGYLTICSLTPDVDEDGRTDNLRYVTCMYGEWRGPTAAGSESRYLNRNPHFEVTIPREGRSEVPIVIQLIQDIKRNQHKSDATSIDIQLLKLPGNEPMLPIFKSPFSRDRQIAHRYKLKPGRYVIVPFTEKAGIEKDFLIRVFSESRLEV